MPAKSTPTTGEKLYEGKAKILYETSDPTLLIQFFKDDATAFNAQKKGTIQAKGVYNCQISTLLYEYLTRQGIPTHFVSKLSDREMLVHRCKIIPIEFIVRNRAAGSLCKRLGIEEGRTLKSPMVEICYKNDALGDPFINDDHAELLGISDRATLDQIRALCRRINEKLVAFFDRLGILLIDFKLEFGQTLSGGYVLADEISPDTCRFWDKKTLEKLDKDRFRQDLGKVEEAYAEMVRRIESAEANQ